MKTLIITIVVIGLTAVIGTLVIGTRTFDGVVTDRPFERGLAWDEEEKARRELGWKVEIGNRRLQVGPNNLMVSLADQGGIQRGAALWLLTVSRASTTRYDRSYEVDSDTDGMIEIPVDFPLYGHWDLKLHVNTEKGTQVLERNVYVEPKGVQGHDAAEPVSRAGSEVDCVFDEGPCIKMIEPDTIQVGLDIDPKPVQAMRELIFCVILKKGERPITDAAVGLSLSMPGMFMGKNEPELHHKGEGLYEGKGVITRCASGRKVWKAEVRIEREGRTGSTGFFFKVP